MLGVAEGTVKSRCFRGREALAEMLGGRQGPHGSDRNVDPVADATAAGRSPDPAAVSAPDGTAGGSVTSHPSARLLCPVPPNPPTPPEGTSRRTS